MDSTAEERQDISDHPKALYYYVPFEGWAVRVVSAQRTAHILKSYKGRPVKYRGWPGYYIRQQ